MSVKRLFETFEPDNYRLELDLSNASGRFFSGRVEISGIAKRRNSISLHSKDLKISKVLFQEQELDFAQKEDDDELEIFAGNASFDIGKKINLNIEFSGQITDGMHGLYPCYYNENGEKKELFATQFESHHAREVFPCVDEPEAKATFELEITALKNLEILANTEILHQTENENLKKIKFKPTPRMSTYLLAFALGDFQRKTAETKSGVKVSVLATKAQDPELLNFPLDFAVRVLEFYEQLFDQKFPLSKCDHLALPDFSSGAMENWGLITYRETALLAGEKSAISSKKYVALVIAHETSHQWFGNLVTMKWWDDLWLNESFATMMEYYAVDVLESNWNMWEEFAVNEAVLSLRRDAIDGVQSVHIPVNHPDEIGTIFDGAIVYAKGARLMNMLRNYLGDDDFRDGLRIYFEKFKYQNTIGADLWQCLSESSGKDVANFMNTWLSQPGYPVISVNGKSGRLNIFQQQFFIGKGSDKGRVWPILLGSTQPSFPQILDQPKITIPFEGGFIQFNRGNIAHFITNYSSELFEKLLAHIHDLDVISRLQILQERSLLARGGLVESVDILRALSHYQDESCLNVWDMMNISIGDLKIFIDEDSASEQKMKLFVENLAKKQFERLGFFAKGNESEEDTQMRSSILGHMIYAENEEVVSGALKIFDGVEKWNEIDAEIRALILLTKIRHDESSEIIQKMLEEYRTTADVDYRDDLMTALTSTRKISTVKNLLTEMQNPKTVRPQDLISWFVHLLRNSHARNLAWDWMRDNWDWIEETFAGDKNYNDFPRYAGGILRTRENLEEFIDFFAPLKNDPSLTRAIEMGEREIRSRVELIERDKAGIEEFLESY